VKRGDWFLLLYLRYGLGNSEAAKWGQFDTLTLNKRLGRYSERPSLPSFTKTSEIARSSESSYEDLSKTKHQRACSLPPLEQSNRRCLLRPPGNSCPLLWMASVSRGFTIPVASHFHFPSSEFFISLSLSPSLGDYPPCTFAFEVSLFSPAAEVFAEIRNRLLSARSLYRN
jgi:hypothetical protein